MDPLRRLVHGLSDFSWVTKFEEHIYLIYCPSTVLMKDSLVYFTRSSLTPSTFDFYPGGGRPRPLAPTCNICLIRDDLTTIWCEVTSSIRTRNIDEEQQPDIMSTITTAVSTKKSKNSSSNSSEEEEQQPSNSSVQAIQIKELLLCLRPIRDGTEKVSEDLRFVPKHKRGVFVLPASGSGSNDDATASNSSKSELNNTKNQAKKNRPMKKRLVG